MIGLVGGLLLACLSFFLVSTKFETSVWIAGIVSLVVLVICLFTGLFGCLVLGLALAALFKADF